MSSDRATRLLPTARGWAELSVAAAALAVPFVVTDVYWLFVLTTLAIYVLVALGLNLLMGYGGQPSMAQGALVALGAYTAGVLTADHDWSFWPAMVAALALPVVLSLVVAVPSFRVSHWYFALVSLGFAIVVQRALFQFRDITHGFTGVLGIPYPTLGGTDVEGRSMFWLVVALDIAAFLVVRNIVRSRLGRGLVAIRDAEIVARSSGVRIIPLKLFAFAVSAVFAGAGGALLATHNGVINPDEFGIELSVFFLLVVLLGGAGHQWGPVVGAVAFFAVPELLESLDRWRLVVYGVALIAVMVFAPRGLTGLIARAWGALVRRLPRTTGVSPVAATSPVTAEAEYRAAPLRAVEVTRRFGGVVALDRVSLEVAAGSIHAVIGPNGSGKTTLLNVISGFYRVDEGEIVVGDRDVTRLSVAARSSSGIGRTFQTPKLVDDLPVVDNVMLGSYAERESTIAEIVVRAPRARREERLRRARAEELLAFVGLAHRRDDEAGSLPHGQQRLVEMARALAGDPGILLLDEPAAGLSLRELDRLADLMSSLRRSRMTIMIVEHHIELVRGTADAVTVLDLGRVVASGRPDDVFDDPDVRSRYLGTVRA